jgi:DNA-binding NarL/FixJ family response regulator
MLRVYLADAKPEERSALRLLLLDLKMEVVGESADWSTTLAQAPVSRTDMLLVDWDLLPSAPSAAIEELRKTCPAALVIVLISHLRARQQEEQQIPDDTLTERVRHMLPRTFNGRRQDR